MALDGVTLAYLVEELAPQLLGARIDKIFQPEKNEVHFLMRQQGTKRLLLNTGATSARLHFTPENKKNPPAPPMFCMILRKHLEGGKILALRQSGLERVVTLEIQNYNERGDLVTLDLHLEIMGKHSNLILVDPGSGVILDGLKRYSHALSRYREVLPGRLYTAPPAQGKLPPTTDEERWQNALYKTGLDRPLPAALLECFAGISPELAKEIVLRADLTPDTLLQQCGAIDLSRLFQAYHRLCLLRNSAHLQPCLYYDPKSKLQPIAFTFTPFHQYENLKQENRATLNDALTEFYQSKADKNNLESKRGSLRKIVQDRHNHFRKKQKIYQEAETKANTALGYQKWGELLTANLHSITEGTREIGVEDYYSPTGDTLLIPLDPQLSPIANAQHYYKLYNKAKATLLKTEPLRKAALNEIQYLDSLFVSLDQATTLSELEEIRRELLTQGYLRIKPSKEKHSGSPKNRSKQKVKSKGTAAKEVLQPRIYHSSQNRIIYVGKNNSQNDWLTLRKGKPNDLWLHVKIIPGSHVLVPLEEGEEFPDDATLEEAAALAVYYSQARGSSQVPVDYTHVRQIKKPKAAKPGMVIYEQNWTLFITPKQEIIERLLAGEEEA